MMADVVEVDAARVAHHHRVGNQRGIVIARGRPSLGILQPAQSGSGGERVGRYPAIGSVGINELLAGLGIRLGYHDAILRQAALETRSPLPLEVVLGWHHDQFEHGDRPSERGTPSRCASIAHARGRPMGLLPFLIIENCPERFRISSAMWPTLAGTW